MFITYAYSHTRQYEVNYLLGSKNQENLDHAIFQQWIRGKAYKLIRGMFIFKQKYWPCRGNYCQSLITFANAIIIIVIIFITKITRIKLIIIVISIPIIITIITANNVCNIWSPITDYFDWENMNTGSYLLLSYKQNNYQTLEMKFQSQIEDSFI